MLNCSLVMFCANFVLFISAKTIPFEDMTLTPKIPQNPKWVAEELRQATTVRIFNIF
jgi:hypothetical protein